MLSEVSHTVVTISLFIFFSQFCLLQVIFWQSFSGFRSTTIETKSSACFISCHSHSTVSTLFCPEFLNCFHDALAFGQSCSRFNLVTRRDAAWCMQHLSNLLMLFTRSLCLLNSSLQSSRWCDLFTFKKIVPMCWIGSWFRLACISLQTQFCGFTRTHTALHSRGIPKIGKQILVSCCFGGLVLY